MKNEEVRYVDGQPAVINRGVLVGMRDSHMVWLWDIGPEKPKPPVKPQVPHGKDGDPEFELAKLESQEALEKFADDLKRYRDMKKEHEDWQKKEGPLVRQFWSTDARDALAHDARAVKEGRQERPRYYIASLTRGYEKARNMGLPHGIKPGKGYERDLQRQIADNDELAKALRADPQFGMETMV